MRLSLLLLCLLSVGYTQAQIDTVVVRVDSMFESKLHRKLYDNRTNVKYHLEERGNVRDIFVFLATLEEIDTGHKMYGVRIDQRFNRAIFTDAPASN
ncbi:MAG: hypothetical protein EAZ17_02635, partial [Sphingobacteriales bacterium]